jgi:PPOX class probable F420-dependent enzyme
MGLDSAKYVSITTRRRNGETVSVPVWIAPLGDGRYCFTTGGDSGKVKRIRNFPDVEIRPCDVRGRLAPGAPVWLATARVVTGEAFEPVRAAVKRKYGLQFWLVEVMGSIRGRFSRSTAADCGVILQLQDA